MADIGKINTLTVAKLTEQGAYLDANDLGEVLLPNRYMPEQLAEGDAIEVFIYFDSSDRLIATTETPKAQMDEFASLKCLAVNKIGAFLDWGLPKDLLVPFNQQHHKMEVGKYYLVKVYKDQYSDRIAATSKIDRFLDIWPANYEIGDRVDLIIANKTDLGFKAIINEKHWGLIFHTDIFQPLRSGLKTQGYIKQVREDGRVNLTLTRSGMGKINDFAPHFLSYLQEHDGVCNINDKSSPEQIKDAFNVSKKTFKSTVGNLLKHGKIRIDGDKILLEKSKPQGAKKRPTATAKSNRKSKPKKR
ncbi:S1-like domain-containing RNA-binding protein [Thalassotalea sp. Y01]|uniref:CvfB family protein n=1 Tax=Thalassotalea sp. Y01 TaxID=2729613 RepID=UPI00145C58F1|nr:S1-like domain-containing RNA-binding protein [Thalassotalea sp. Y01]NMP15933.1 GntR family transcriptional regulator [Thalassotalea sp. Y01]